MYGIYDNLISISVSQKSDILDTCVFYVIFAVNNKNFTPVLNNVCLAEAMERIACIKPLNFFFRLSCFTFIMAPYVFLHPQECWSDNHMIISTGNKCLGWFA